MTADEVKDALRARHPATDQNGFVGPWTCLEEWNQIDLLALAAWTMPRPARARHARVGYEVKVTRGDLRRELRAPGPLTDAQVALLARWTSVRPDPRHEPLRRRRAPL